MRRKAITLLSLTAALVTLSVVATYAWTAVPVTEDPLVRMPGTQPEDVTLEGAGRCLNCHADYSTAVEPGYNWKGSMMAQSARDFLFWSCLTVAGQDSIWALGNPNAVDICERCHFPKGWLEGRSDPPNGSAMTGDDYDGVQCDFCHSMWDPFFETTYSGDREGSDWLGYWDETNASDTPSQPAADATYAEDATLAQAIVRFDGEPFYEAGNVPFSLDYIENGGGQYFVSSNGDKRGPFADADARHRMFYSRYHKSKYFCSTCHDVSNPALANLGQDGTQALTTETDSAYSYFHVERTFSEFMLSAYGQQGGAPTNPEFQAQGAPNITAASTCQDCHMRDVVGVGADMNGAPVRPDESVEHPNSGQPLHDMTGGNLWVSAVLASAVSGSPNYDATNDDLLNQGPDVLTLDLGEGEGIDPAAVLAGVDRARQQLLLAATIKNVDYDSSTGNLAFQVQNNTAHKLISGFPEGRRMFVNVKAYDDGSLVHEVNPYDATADTLRGLPTDYSPNSPATGPNEAYVDALVYEMHPSSTLTGEDKTFHFALATGRYKDNRIPPKGFDIANAADRLSEPVWNGVEEPDYFSAEEYAGGYDDVSLTITPDADYVEINLYYQTTSREYIEFLRDEINGTGNLTLTGTGAGGDPPYIIQSDPFFGQLRAWGDTIWQLWTHNADAPGAAPFLMAQAAVGDTSGGCAAPTPGLLSATAGHNEVEIAWSDESADTSVTGYKVYYDQGGKAQVVAEITDPTVTAFTDTGLSDGIEYCYKVTSYHDASCESDYSNILCATPPVPVSAPDAFSKTSPTDGATDQPTDLTLSWVTSGGATSYEYCVDTTDDNACDVTWTNVGTDTITSPSGLGYGTTYYWQVRAINATGMTEANDGDWWQFTTEGPPPASFSKTDPTDGATDQPTDLSLSWGTSDGATGYEYCFDATDDDSCGGTWTDAGTSTSAALSGLSSDTTYYWQVRARNATDTTEADGGTWWQFTTQVSAPAAFGKTGPIDGAAAQPTELTLSWETSGGAESYEYCIDETDDDACDDGWTSIGATTSVLVSGLSNDANYYWQVRARNTADTTEADGGTWWYFTTQVSAPDAFSKTSPTDGATDQPTDPTLSWGASSGAESYEYCIDGTDNDACDASWTSVGGDTSVLVSGLSNDVTYYWQVRAVNPASATEADSGTWWRFTTEGPPPASFLKTGPADGATDQPTDLTLSWGASDGATGYEYCVDATDDDSCGGFWTDAGTDISANLSGLSNDTTYYWQVRARNSTGRTEADGGTWWDFSTAPAGSLAYESHVVDDDTSTSDGDGDGIVECGETIELNVLLRNQGGETVTGVAATLSSLDSYITITDSDESFPDIAGGGTEQDLDDYDFQVAADVPNEHVVHFDLAITASNGGPWSDGFDITVYCAPEDFWIYVPVVVRGGD